MKENFVCIPVDVSRNWSLKNLTSSLFVVVVVVVGGGGGGDDDDDIVVVVDEDENVTSMHAPLEARS
jgi:hypothetical protein